MAKPNIPAGLPDSALLHALAKKTATLKTAQSRTPSYLEWLKSLRDRIAPELSYTNITFPLFTPHDEQNHIHPLFVLTERLLGSEIIDSLNATELFVFACSLYAHDWGMAVSEAEKKCVMGLGEPTVADSFTLLDGDRVAFAKLLKDNRIAEPTALSDVPFEVWQTYIRNTHAARSAHRVRAFFSPIDANLGEAVALVSEGHNLDVEHLRPFETALPLQGESANIRALALYLRLIDLFDLAQDRTPYALWKFVSPENPKSAEEWNKHRALSPVVIEQFQETSRCLKIRGATDDHRVYAALEDLREYCDSQLRLSNGLLNELDPRYQPHLLHLDWKVEPKGFEPITVRFEFERQAMINVLSDEIYQGDRHVFLRELLQNSIDAIRLRRALHQSKNTGVTFDGAIHVKVEHGTDGCATVSWDDNGCGMSAFIVRNYLTVAGRSFYRSEDFQKLGVQMDPISRFGVGILSCFMVGERLEVITRQDPQLETAAEALKIEVHNPKRHLRIQRILPNSLPAVGTTMKVFVGSSSPKDEGKSATANLNVTEYLKDIAGFVEFPIYIDEDGRQTLILHPDRVGSVEKITGWEVASLSRSFAWQDFFVPQDVQRAREYFTEETISFRPTSKNQLFEGTISYPVLNEDIELRHDYSGRHDESAHIAIQRTKELGRIRVRQKWGSEKRLSGNSRSSACDNLCRIYCDGVLVPGVSVPDWVGGGWMQPSTFRIVLNIRRTAGTRLDLSRHDIAEGDHNWSDFVFQRCLDAFRKQAKQIVTEKTPREALYHLARLVAYGGGFRRNLAEIIGHCTVPLLVLGKTGDIVVSKPDALDGDIVNVVPKNLAEGLAKTLFAHWASTKWLQGKAPRIPWFGERCVFSDGMTYTLGISDEPSSLRAVEELHEARLNVSHVLTGIRFLTPSKKDQPPLLQEVWLVKESTNLKAKERGKRPELDPQAITHLTKIRYEFSHNSPKYVSFAAPFEGFFTAGWKYLNDQHPVTKLLAECIKSIADKQSVRGISEHDLGTIRDALEPLFGERRHNWRDYLSGSQIDEKCESIQRLFDLASRLEIFELSADIVWSRETLNVPPVVKAGKLGAPIRSLLEVGFK
jgi:hypothetical protein